VCMLLFQYLELFAPSLYQLMPLLRTNARAAGLVPWRNHLQQLSRSSSSSVMYQPAACVPMPPAAFIYNGCTTIEQCCIRLLACQHVPGAAPAAVQPCWLPSKVSAAGVGQGRLGRPPWCCGRTRQQQQQRPPCSSAARHGAGWHAGWDYCSTFRQVPTWHMGHVWVTSGAAAT
jgi:hypothetical protein